MIHWAHLGNGITVWHPTKMDERTNDHQILAHIYLDRTVELRVEVDGQQLHEILEVAATQDPEVSITQNQKVFDQLAKDVVSIKIVKKYKDKRDKNRVTEINLKSNDKI